MKEEKKYSVINKKNLLKALRTIGWGLYHGGHGFYYIENQLGNTTQWRFRVEDDLSPIHELSFEGQFGEQKESYVNGGSCVFILKGCTLTSRKDAVGIVVKENSITSKPAFINFYNFDRN